MTTKTYDRQTAKFIARVAENLPEMMGDVMQGWIDNPRALQKFLAGLIPPQAVNDGTLTVNYTLSLNKMIAAGHYDWMHDNITAKRFPNTETGVKEITAEIVHFDRTISSDDAIAEMRRRGLRPATLAELLAYGAQFPDAQRKFPIVALGSAAKFSGYSLVPCLFGDGSERSLRLGWIVGGWDEYFRFLAVRN